MKRVIVESEKNAYEELLGKKVCIISLTYIYAGELTGVNDTCIALKNAQIVYDTGSWSKASWEEAEALPCEEYYVSIACIESFGEIDK